MDRIKKMQTRPAWFEAAGLQVGPDNIVCYGARSCTTIIPSLANTGGEGCAPCSREAATAAAERDEGAGFLGVELLGMSVKFVQIIMGCVLAVGVVFSEGWVST